jgi:hypothetical protein
MTAVVVGRRLAMWRTVTPLGIRFWDPALDTAVDDGLAVWAFRADAPGLGASPGGGVRAVRTKSGVYALEGLPGLAEFEHPAPDAPPGAALIASPPFAADFVIAVRDERVPARFLPMAFTVRLPLATRGLFLGDAPGGARVPLFSAPTRPVPAGLSAVRAELLEIDGPDAPRPAAHAALRVDVGGTTWTGVADERGRVLVVFPTPTAIRLSLGSPPGSGGGGDVAAQSWPLVVRAAWDPGRLRFPLAGTRGAAAAWADVPSIKSVLDEQPPALLFDADDAAPADALHPELHFARELVLRTRLTGVHADVPEEAGRLWLSRGASPP